MNRFTELSIELANRYDYLDQLFRVYPLAPDSIRNIPEDIWHEIERSYNSKDNDSLFRSLLKLKLFPIKDSYVSFFRKDPSAIIRNPNTINRICGRVRELGLTKIYERISEPKETNRQIGPLFKRWVESGVLGVFPTDIDTFRNLNKNAILKGSDALLKEYASEHLGFKREDKGLDFIGRFNNKYIIGEAKFLTDEGGHQNDQFLDAMTTLNVNTRRDVRTIAILDGTLYIKSNRKIYNIISNQDINVMSALVLREYLNSL